MAVRFCEASSRVPARTFQYLQFHPVEIGGVNAGPWVRLYMGGAQGNDYPWCAGFVTYVVRQAAGVHNADTPISRTFSCDVIGMEAKGKPGKFVTRISPTQARVGSVFLVPHGTNKNDLVHTGIIVDPDAPGPGAVFCTIEGNTNDEGSREGFEVCERLRACSAVDVVLL